MVALLLYFPITILFCINNSILLQYILIIILTSAYVAISCTTSRADRQRTPRKKDSVLVVTKPPTPKIAKTPKKAKEKEEKFAESVRIGVENAAPPPPVFDFGSIKEDQKEDPTNLSEQMDSNPLGDKTIQSKFMCPRTPTKSTAPRRSACLPVVKHSDTTQCLTKSVENIHEPPTNATKLSKEVDNDNPTAVFERTQKKLSRECSREGSKELSKEGSNEVQQPESPAKEIKIKVEKNKKSTESVYANSVPLEYRVHPVHSYEAASERPTMATVNNFESRPHNGRVSGYAMDTQLTATRVPK